jgi:hypothetical protein
VPLIFQTRPGQVVKLDDPAMSCNANFLSLNPNIAYETERSIITRMTISQQVNVQFLHTLGSLIYIYVFGDRMGQVALSGLSFLCGCEDEAEADSQPTVIGAERMLTWYKNNRASKRATPVRVTVGKTVIEGYVTSFTEDVVDPSLKMVQWGVNLATLPEDD